MHGDLMRRRPCPAAANSVGTSSASQSLTTSHPHRVCGLNVHLVEGLVEALDEVDGNTLQTPLDPAPGRCCATVSEVA